MPARYWILIITLGIAFGGSFFFNAILLKELGPMTISMGRVFLGALGCWVWVSAKGKNPFVSWAVLCQLMILGLFQYAAPFALLPLAQKYVSSGMAGTVNGMTPVMVVLVSHFWVGGEKISPAKSVGVVIGFSGIVILAWPALQASGSEFWAILVAFLAPVSYSVALNYVRRLRGIDPTVMTAWALSCATILLVPTALAIEGVPVITKIETWVSLAILGFVMTSICFIAIFWLLPKTGATTVSTVTFIAPISAVMLGIAFLGETLTQSHVAGMGVILTGLLMIDGRFVKLLATPRSPNSA
ncbi:DMT family transporter [Pseudohalocynthiibacter aestuariivivens]|jgi:drug/metabolite transporter (DMT)-like permease|uniref:DMT family transporter n=1 Tax=Pseudohalocynthiibacter aestuariivivens TaxID=1591409 RepID=A0ABV5JDW0_9RHOB|nr:MULTISPECIES: DMT family transporter [Pseudohalocynthiibacter]MBS9718636.1 DMT family transporter [Pseudohalocynthiibacter aestuariivivens]MCK0104111.1 DMT family transporter [Pseudohalocynthiibacter sp. F2068]